MAKCNQCNVKISDNTTVCPLCNCVVESQNMLCGTSVLHDAENMRAGTESYPDVWLHQRHLQHLCNIALFAVMLASAVLAVLNYAFYEDSLWCMIPIAAMIYAYIIFRLVIISKKGYRVKTLIPLLLAIVLAVIVDAETGFYGWSLNFVLPGMILVADLIILILVLTNLKNWQSYIIMQIGMAVFSLIPLLLWVLGYVTIPLLSIIAFGVSLFLFLGMVIIGDRTARGELRRRFHIR